MPTPVKAEWGPELHSNDYQLLIQDADYPRLLDLSCGWSLGQPEFEKTDPVKLMFNCLVAGRIVPRTKTLRGALIRERSYPLMTPQGRTLWTPLQVLEGGNCERDVFIKYLCPSDNRHAHFIQFQDATFDEAEETSVLVEGAENAAPLTSQSMMHTFARRVHYYISVHEAQTDADGAAHAIAFAFPDCRGCNPYEHRNLFYGGDEYLKVSDDAGATGTDAGAAIPTDGIIEDILVDGNLILAAVSVSTTDGAILRSIDGGTSWASVGPTTNTFFDLFKAGGYYWAVGGEGAVYYSSDGGTWTAVTTPFASGVYSMGAVDPETGTIYVVGTSGGAGKLISISGFAATDLTALLPGTPTALYAVHMLATDHIVAGGASGYFAENDSLSDGSNLVEGAVGAGNVRGIQGDRARLVVSSGATLWQRDVNTYFDFASMPLETGVAIAGEIHALTSGRNDLGDNYFAAATESGEILIIYPSYPQAI